MKGINLQNMELQKSIYHYIMMEFVDNTSRELNKLLESSKWRIKQTRYRKCCTRIR